MSYTLNARQLHCVMIDPGFVIRNSGGQMIVEKYLKIVNKITVNPQFIPITNTLQE